MIPARAALAAFVVFIATAPLFLAEFHVTLMNYIGLATMIALEPARPTWRGIVV